MYLLDTNVVSELRRVRPHGAVVAWLSAVPAATLSISAMTLGELQAGVEITRDRNPVRAAELEAWLDQVAASGNVLPLDGPVCRVWARLMHRRPDRLIGDAMIAATAIVHGLTVVTRNLRDFEVFGVAALDSFAGPGRR